MSEPRASHFTLPDRVQAMLDVAVALAEALVESAVIPGTSLPAIRASARVELYDLAAIDTASRDAGNLLIPLMTALRLRVAEQDRAAAGHVHWGATSQDVIDTALVLQLQTAGAAVLASLDRSIDGVAVLARRHVATPIAGRTWLQQATPTTFGAKAAGWLDGLASARQRLAAALEDARVVQLGGASGTLASLGDAGPAVTDALASRLGLRVPDIPWHTDRGRLVAVACACGIVCGALGKVGRDVALLAQTEVGEVAEPSGPGRGGSSSMPHKRNPVAAAAAVAAAMRAPGLVATMLAAMPQEHERALGGWQAEWETLPALVDVTADAAAAMAGALPHLVVHEARMRENLDAQGGVARAEGLVAALAPHVGRGEALALVEHVCSEALAHARPLAQMAAGEPRIRALLGEHAIERALDPSSFAGSSRLFVERVLRRWQREGG